MGLDMYLYRRHYVKNWEWMKEETWTVQVLRNLEVPRKLVGRRKK